MHIGLCTLISHNFRTIINSLDQSRYNKYVVEKYLDIATIKKKKFL